MSLGTTLINQRLDIQAVTMPRKTGQFEVIADGAGIAERGGNWFTRSFGAGYPDLDSARFASAFGDASRPISKPTMLS